MPPGTLTRLQSNLGFIHAVDNLDAATDGVDGETIDELKQRGPLWLRTGDRAVTVGDYERLTLRADQRVRRVDTVDNESARGVSVFVIPNVEDESAIFGASEISIGNHCV